MHACMHGVPLLSLPVIVNVTLMKLFSGCKILLMFISFKDLF